MIDVLRSLGLNPITADCDKLIKDSDLKDKAVDFPTFVTIYDQFKKRPCIANHADMMEAFKTFDRDSSGNVFGAEMRQILLNLGDKMSEGQVDFLIHPHENQDGYLPYDALIKFVMAG